MLDAIFDGVRGLGQGLHHLNGAHLVMLAIAGTLIYLGAAKGIEPLLLVPIGFGCLLANVPLSELMIAGGVLNTLYEFGIRNELFPLLIFVGIGAMTDFTPLLANPRLILFGAAGQLGIFVTLLLALSLGFSREASVAIAAIGACDGPTVIYVANLLEGQGRIDTGMVGSLAVTAYSYMALVPVIQPPIMRALVGKKEREVRMQVAKATVSRTALILFPILVTLVTGLIAPQGLPLMGMIMLGNFMKATGAVSRLTKTAENELTNLCTLFLGLAIGGTMQGATFLRGETLLIFALGFVAIVIDTVGGLLLGKLWYSVSGGRINPLIGAAGLSAYPIAARLVQAEGQRWNRQNFLLMHAVAANTGGQIGSIVAAAIMLSVLRGLGIIGS